jgi:hypothetical protein
MFRTKAQRANWGDPAATEPPYASSEYYEREIRLQCQEQWKMNERPMSELLNTATVIHSSNPSRYDSFESTDWIPENKDLYSNGSPWGPKFDFPSKKKTVSASSCRIPNIDKIHQWEITRIGPFRTTGGYDWTQIGWDNLWGISDLLETYPEGILLLRQYLSPVLKDGTRVSHPPLHIHHMHIGPSPYVRQRRNPVDCVLRGRGCWDPVTVVEVHGDDDCRREGNGTSHDCRIEHYPTG